MVCHQANARIIDHVAKRLKAREGLFYKNMDRYGNTSAASIPIALDELVQSGALLPGMLGGMKYVGAAYILWLAAHIAVSRPDRDGKERSASFLKGFMLQFVNVKIYLFGITALTGYVTNYSTALPVLVFFEFVIATIGTAATSAWIGAGMAIQKVYLRHYRLINIILAVTLLECVYSILK